MGGAVGRSTHPTGFAAMADAVPEPPRARVANVASLGKGVRAFSMKQ